LAGIYAILHVSSLKVFYILLESVLNEGKIQQLKNPAKTANSEGNALFSQPNGSNKTHLSEFSLCINTSVGNGALFGEPL